MSSGDWASMYQNQAYYPGVENQVQVNTTSHGQISLQSAQSSGVIFQTTTTYGNGYWPIISDGINLYQQQTTYPPGLGNVPVTIEPDKMRSKMSPETGPHDHLIECRLTVENVRVYAEYFCFHCNEVVYRKVISKLPASIMNKKCLPRLVKGV
jgi:hypothetical protein